jgi:hypothetical protein
MKNASPAAALSRRPSLQAFFITLLEEEKRCGTF